MLPGSGIASKRYASLWLPAVSEPARSGFSFPSLVEEIRRTGLSTKELAAITGVQERQVQHWVAGTSRPGPETRDRLVDVYYIVQQLAEVYRPDGIEIRLHARNPELGGERPVDLLLAGEFQPVVDAVERLQVGAV